jgi:hypothetical protein
MVHLVRVLRYEPEGLGSIPDSIIDLILFAALWPSGSLIL